MEKMKGVMPKKVTPELVAGNKDVVAAARKMKRGGGSLSQQASPEQMTAAQKANQAAGVNAMNKYIASRSSGAKRYGGKAKDMGKMSGNKAHGRADRKARKSGGMCSSDWTAAQGEGQKPRG